MVFTSQLLVFTRVGHDELVDIIPLKDILAVNGSETEELGTDPYKFFIDDQDAADDFQPALEIMTMEDGYNSGRAYKIRVVSEKDRRAIIEDLSRFSAREREKAVAKSKFKKSQQKLAVLVNSNWVQRILAIFIVAV
jgi:hypothetical protein